MPTVFIFHSLQEAEAGSPPKNDTFFFFVQPGSETFCFELASIAFGAETKQHKKGYAAGTETLFPLWTRLKPPKFQEELTAQWALTQLGGWAQVFNSAPRLKAMSCVVSLLNPPLCSANL